MKIFKDKKITILFMAIIMFFSIARASEKVEVEIKLTVIAGDEENGAMSNSVLIEASKELILVDAQRSNSNAKKVVAAIQASGKQLTTIFITHPHPDHYLGTIVIKEHFPDAVVVSSDKVSKVIASRGEETRQMLLQMTKGTPSHEEIPGKIIIPAKLEKRYLQVDHYKLPIIEISNGETQSAAVVHVPQLKTLIAGDLLYNQVHLWLREGRFQDWKKALSRLRSIKKFDQVIPGHGDLSKRSLIQDNIQYIKDFEKAVNGSKDSKEAVTKLTRLYPSYKMQRFLTYGVDGYFEQKK